MVERRAGGLTSIAIFFALTAISTPVAAQDAARPWFVAAGVGVGVRLDGFVPAAFASSRVGLHLDGTPVGPFFALMLAEDIASYFSGQVGVRIGWDLEVLRREDFSIVLAPSLGVAFAFDVGTAQGDYAYFLVQPSLGAGVLLLDRMLGIWLRPIVVDVYIGELIHGGWGVVLGATLAF